MVSPGSIVQVETTAMATGGEAVARLPDGRVVFIAGALVGETVAVELLSAKKKFARAVVRDVIHASPQRRDPGCTHARSGECGGCDWMFVIADEQLRLKTSIVIEQLERLGGISAPAVVASPSSSGGRTTVRCVVVDGRAGYRTRRSNAGFGATECMAVHPRLEELIVGSSFADAPEVTLRVGVETGDRMAIIEAHHGEIHVPADVMVVDAAEPGEAAIFEVVDGHRFRISARSFFQTSQTGAESLVGAVRRALGTSEGPVADLFAGVGLLGATAAADRLVVAVELNSSSAADARVNLPSDVEVVESSVENWSARPVDAVIADPARRGLQRQGVAVVAATGANQVVLVSCDPAALGRDAGLLIEAGYSFAGAEVIEMFPDTSRIEVVSAFTK